MKSILYRSYIFNSKQYNTKLINMEFSTYNNYILESYMSIGFESK